MNAAEEGYLRACHIFLSDYLLKYNEHVGCIKTVDSSLYEVEKHHIKIIYIIKKLDNCQADSNSASVIGILPKIKLTLLTVLKHLNLLNTLVENALLKTVTHEYSVFYGALMVLAQECSILLNNKTCCKY